MKRRMVVTLLALAAFCLAGAPALADDAALLRAIKDKVHAAVRILAEEGRDGLEQFNDVDGRWGQEPYVFVFDEKGVILAHANDQALVGKTLLGITDVKGRRFIQDAIDIVKGPGRGWSEYWWYEKPHNEHKHKLSYIMAVPGQPMGVGAGVQSDITVQEANRLVAP